MREVCADKKCLDLYSSLMGILIEAEHPAAACKALLYLLIFFVTEPLTQYLSIPFTLVYDVVVSLSCNSIPAL